MHQNVGHLCSREGGWVYKKVHEKSPETEKITGIFAVPHTECSGWAFTAAQTQRYVRGWRGPPLKICYQMSPVCWVWSVSRLQHMLKQIRLKSLYSCFTLCTCCYRQERVVDTFQVFSLTIFYTSSHFGKTWYTTPCKRSLQSAVLLINYCCLLCWNPCYRLFLQIVLLEHLGVSYLQRQVFAEVHWRIFVEPHISQGWGKV